ncbi:MAG: polysaccharide biosynthesis/export family protein [Sphingomonadaceae bacterium]
MRTIFSFFALALLPQLAIAQTAVPASVTRDYTLTAGDEIEVYVWGEERLQRAMRILPDGSFSFPLTGRIVATGKTITEIEALVSKGLESQYRGQVPQVTVSVRAPAGLQFSVAGRVRTPGTFTPGRYVNVLEALTLAGGPDEFANLDNIQILRKSGTGLVNIKVRLQGVFKGNIPAGGLSQGSVPAIESGDTVIVP